MLGTGFGILGRQQNKNRYHITKLILCTGFWDSRKAAKNRYHIVMWYLFLFFLPAQNTKTLLCRWALKEEYTYSGHSEMTDLVFTTMFLFLKLFWKYLLIKVSGIWYGSRSTRRKAEIVLIRLLFSRVSRTFPLTVHRRNMTIYQHRKY
jgi:hypothetical protein